MSEERNSQMATSDPNKTGSRAEDKPPVAKSASSPATASMDPADRDQAIAGDASVANVPVRGEVTVTEGASAPFSTKPSDVPVDPRSGQPFGDNRTDGLKGTHGADIINATGSVVPGVNPDRIPAEVTPGVTPDAGGDRLFAAALAKAPSLTREFVDKMGISDEQLGQIARGEIPPPPTPGPIYTADMYMTPGGFQQTPPGVPPEDVGGNAVTR